MDGSDPGPLSTYRIEATYAERPWWGLGLVLRIRTIELTKRTTWEEASALLQRLRALGLAARMEQTRPGG